MFDMPVSEANIRSLLPLKKAHELVAVLQPLKHQVLYVVSEAVPAQSACPILG